MGRARCSVRVKGLDCPVEVAAIRAALAGAPGIVGPLGFDLVHGTVAVEYDPEVVDAAALARRVTTRAGMKAELAGPGEVDRPGWWDRNGRWASTIASGLILLVGMGIDHSGGRWAVGAYAAAILAGAVDLAPRALGNLRRFRLDIHVLMAAAIVGAIALGQWDEAATVAFLFNLSEALEALSVRRARRSIRALLEVAPEVAERVEADGRVSTVDASAIREGDRVRVRSGARIPVDGRVSSGRSSVDQKAITGESVAVLREPGDEVFAGSVNGDGALEVEASGPLADALISRVADRVREAQASRSPVERTVEAFARRYTPAVVFLSLALMLAPPLTHLAYGHPAGWGVWFERGLVALVIACPCALVIATPVALASSLAAAARRGILVKGGEFVEEIGRLKVLAFDKTGTLTTGEPDVVEVVSAAGGPAFDANLLGIAAALGDQGGHVLGRAISRHARALQVPVPTADAYEAVPGLGASARVGEVRYHIGSHRYIDEAGLCPPDFHARFERAEADGSVGTSVALTAPGGPVGWIRLADRPRPGAVEVVRRIRELGLDVVMLTGDNPSTAASIARDLGIVDHRGGLLPADKASIVARLIAEKGPTGMVGDGVNDAQALAAARVSVSLGGVSSASALETADVVIMADDLAGLPWLVGLGRDTLSTVRWNIGLALGSKAVVLALAALGLATLWMAILADVGVSLLVTANALRLLGRKA